MIQGGRKKNEAKATGHHTQSEKRIDCRRP